MIQAESARPNPATRLTQPGARLWNVARGILLFCVIAAMPMGARSQAQTAANGSEVVVANAVPTTPQKWRNAAQRDLEAAREILRTQTPIPFDRENPGYGAWLENGFTEAQALVEDVHDEAGHFYLLARFVNGFEDPHLFVSPLRGLTQPRWPGFVASWQEDGGIIVFRDETDPDAPAIGTRILTCDGRTLSSLAEDLVFPYVLNRRVALDRRRATTRLFLDRSIPWAPPPARCVVASATGEREIQLRWRPLPEPSATYYQSFRDASTGPAAEWGISEPALGVTWIGVPTFSSGPEDAAKLEDLLEQIQQRGQSMRSGRAIVIDLRGNGGGNSAWADRIAIAVFGRGPIAAARRAVPDRSVVDWRASPENAAFWRRWVTDVAEPQFGMLSTTALYGRWVSAGLGRAIERGDPLWRENQRRDVPAGGGITSQRPAGESPFPATVYVLTNGSCGSSCLMFADTVLFVPGVKLVGSATSGDGLYMEIRSQDLPSGLASITFPQKVSRGSARGAFEAYQPDIPYRGSWDDEAVRSWLLAVIASGTTQTSPDVHSQADPAGS